MLCDNSSVAAVEVLPNAHRFVTGNPIVQTNRYLFDDWNSEYFLYGNYSLARQLSASYMFDTDYQQGPITNNVILGILGFKGEWNNMADSEICRTNGSSQTIAFMTKQSFGIGNVYDGVGQLPF
jgi:hypothetical protein